MYFKEKAVEIAKIQSTEASNFTKQGIRELCPALSVSSIEGALRKLVKTGELKRGGSGKGTYYVRLK